jgi:membrane protease YdiL (CAAX protease family)
MTMNELRRTDDRNGADLELWLFLCLIVLGNTIFIIAVAQGLLPLGAYSLGRFLLLGGILVATVFYFRGAGAVLDLVRPMANWRVNIGWYALALLWAPTLCFLTVFVISKATGTEAPAMSDVLLQNPRLAVTVLFAAFVGEIVWVSYAIGRLSRRTTVLEASLVVGTFWTLWWVPIVIFGAGVIPGLPLPALFLNMLGVAAMCGFVYHWTKSGLIVLLLQVMVNSSLLIFPVTPTDEGTTTYYIFSVVYFIAAISMHVFFGPRPLFTSRRKQLTGQVT